MDNRDFEKIVVQYSEKLYWQVRRIVLNHEDANDVVQNAFIKAWTKIDTFEGKSSIYTWLSRIAINEALDFVRSNKSKFDVATPEDLPLASKLLADEYFDGDEIEAQLQEAVANLPEIQRVVFNLKYFEEKKYSEISKILGTTEGALKASYHHAVKKIEEFFKRRD